MARAATTAAVLNSVLMFVRIGSFPFVCSCMTIRFVRPARGNPRPVVSSPECRLPQAKRRWLGIIARLGEFACIRTPLGALIARRAGFSTSLHGAETERAHRGAGCQSQQDRCEPDCDQPAPVEGYAGPANCHRQQDQAAAPAPIRASPV